MNGRFYGIGGLKLARTAKGKDRFRRTIFRAFGWLLVSGYVYFLGGSESVRSLREFKNLWGCNFV